MSKSVIDMSDDERRDWQAREFENMTYGYQVGSVWPTPRPATPSPDTAAIEAILYKLLATYELPHSHSDDKTMVAEATAALAALMAEARIAERENMQYPERLHGSKGNSVSAAFNDGFNQCVRAMKVLNDKRLAELKRGKR